MTPDRPLPYRRRLPRAPRDDDPLPDFAAEEKFDRVFPAAEFASLYRHALHPAGYGPRPD